MGAEREEVVVSERERRWLPLDLAEAFEPVAAALGVSDVARSKRGFFPQYKRAGGDPDRLDPWWRNRRNNFVKRHMAQLEAGDEPLVDQDGLPTRRHLALIMWAYSPMSDAKLEKVLGGMKTAKRNGRRTTSPREGFLLPLTPAQASFLEVEVVGGLYDDEDPDLAELAESIDVDLQESGGRSVIVTNVTLLRQVVLDIINGMEELLSADEWDKMGGVETKAQARGLERTGQALWQKLGQLK